MIVHGFDTDRELAVYRTLPLSELCWRHELCSTEARFAVEDGNGFASERLSAMRSTLTSAIDDVRWGVFGTNLGAA